MTLTALCPLSCKSAHKMQRCQHFRVGPPLGTADCACQYIHIQGSVIILIQSLPSSFSTAEEEARIPNLAQRGFEVQESAKHTLQRPPPPCRMYRAALRIQVLHILETSVLHESGNYALAKVFVVKQVAQRLAGRQPLMPTLLTCYIHRLLFFSDTYNFSSSIYDTIGNIGFRFPTAYYKNLRGSVPILQHGMISFSIKKLKRAVCSAGFCSQPCRQLSTSCCKLCSM